MAVSIVQKHGLVPCSVYPESETSGGTLAMNNTLKEVLRTSACEIRKKRQEGASVEQLREYKELQLSGIWRILAMHLGTPPEIFSLNYYDKDNKFIRLPRMSPNAFLQKYVDPSFSSYVCLVNDPRNPYMQTYTVDFLQVSCSCVHIDVVHARASLPSLYAQSRVLWKLPQLFI